MNQKSYIKEVLKRFNMKECKLVKTMFNANLKLLKISDEEFENVKRKMEGVPDKAGVGHLMHALVATRADIAFVVSTTCQYYVEGRSTALDCSENIIRYLKGILDFKLCLKGKDIDVRGFCNADLVGDSNDWWSTMGYVCFYWHWSHFMGMQETTNHYIIYDGGRVHGQ